MLSSASQAPLHQDGGGDSFASSSAPRKLLAKAGGVLQWVGVSKPERLINKLVVALKPGLSF